MDLRGEITPQKRYATIKFLHCNWKARKGARLVLSISNLIKRKVDDLELSDAPDEDSCDEGSSTSKRRVNNQKNKNKNRRLRAKTKSSKSDIDKVAPTSKPNTKRKRSTKKKKPSTRRVASDVSESDDVDEGTSESEGESSNAESDDERARKFRKMDEDDLAGEKGGRKKLAVDLDAVFGPKETVERDGKTETVFPCLVCR